MKIKRLIAIAALPLSLGCTLAAQGLYDDIYYNPKKDATPTKTVKARPSTTTVNVYPGADTYIVTGTSTRTVDDYNRRGFFAIADSTAAPTDTVAGDFAYTRRIEQFHNPAILSGSNDAELMELYYSQPADITINVINPGFGYSYGYPYYDSYWAWNYPYRYGWGWDWAWGPSWSWGWGPSWSWSPAWSWGWGPSWAWGPSWSWGWNPGYAPARPANPRHPGAAAHRPGNGSGPVYGGGNTNTRPMGNGGYRPGGTAGGYRPGSTGAGVRPGTTGTRPGTTTRPAGNGGYRPGGTTTRPSTTTTSPRPSNNYNNNNYNSGSRHSGGSYSRPSGGGMGGGRMGGGGGGGRSGGRH